MAENKVYEIGFHMIPTLSSDDAEVLFSDVKKSIEKENGELVSEGAPEEHKLAYPLESFIGEEKKTFNNSFFAWIKFRASAKNAKKIQKNLKDNDTFLRELLIETIQEETYKPKTKAYFEAREEERDTVETKETLMDESDSKKKKVRTEKVEDKKPMTEDDKKELDDAIEELVSE